MRHNSPEMGTVLNVIPHGGGDLNATIFANVVVAPERCTLERRAVSHIRPAIGNSGELRPTLGPEEVVC